jgi:hypothetical protein
MKRPVPRGAGRAFGFAAGIALLLLTALSAVPSRGPVAGGSTPIQLDVAATGGPVYEVNFTAADLAPANAWSVNLSGNTESAVVPWIVFSEPNGSYPYRASTTDGGGVVWVNGTVVVPGGPIEQSITFYGEGAGASPPANSPAASSSTSQGPLAFWIAAAVVGVVVVTLGTLVVAQRRGKGKPPRGSERSTDSVPTSETATPGAASPDDPLGHML